MFDRAHDAEAWSRLKLAKARRAFAQQQERGSSFVTSMNYRVRELLDSSQSVKYSKHSERPEKVIRSSLHNIENCLWRISMRYRPLTILRARLRPLERNCH